MCITTHAHVTIAISNFRVLLQAKQVHESSFRTREYARWLLSLPRFFCLYFYKVLFRFVYYFAIVVFCNRYIVTKVVVIIIPGVNRSASEKFDLVTQLISIRLVSIGAIKQVVFVNYCLLYEAFVLHYFISRSQNRP